MQQLLQRMIDECAQRRSATEVLCCLEVWMLWLCRHADLEDSTFQADAARQQADERLTPFRELARTLSHMLLRCLLPLDEVKPDTAPRFCHWLALCS
jgi:hypothetical protein